MINDSKKKWNPDPKDKIYSITKIPYKTLTKRIDNRSPNKPLNIEDETKKKLPHYN